MDTGLVISLAVDAALERLLRRRFRPSSPLPTARVRA
jgi:hypothetical protein